MRKKTTEQFIEMSIKKHGDKYNYSKVEYIHGGQNVIIFCKEHGDFFQIAQNHLSGKGCKKCAMNLLHNKSRSNNEEFIEMSIKKHGDLYDYSNVEYVNAKTDVIVICRIHGEFLQTPNCHLTGSGCNACGNTITGIKRRSNTDDFVEKSKLIHGNKFDYSNTVYVASTEKTTIICREHGEFQQTPHGHLSGNGCNACGNAITGIKKRSDTDDFVEKSKLIHGNKFDYSNVEYTNSSTKVKIICRIHGEFQQTPNGHLSGYGCKKCSIEYINDLKRLSFEEFMKKANEKHGERYDYSKVEYKNINEKIIIICKIHGEFQQTVQTHINLGCNCSKCSDIESSIKQRSNIDEFIEKSKKVHGDTYDYSNVEYVNAKTDVIVICKKHGEFSQSPDSHTRGSGCRICGYLSQATNKTIKKTKTDFIKEATEIHGDAYDYSLLEYKNTETKVKIICKVHGIFNQSPYGHLTGRGCKKCATYIQANKRRSNTEEFIEKAIEKHGDIYDYSKVEYINNTTEVVIICKEHGEYTQLPSNHLMGKKCSKCSNVYQITKDEFIEKATQKYGDIYDYTNIEYDSLEKNITILCKNHGLFLQTPRTHLSSTIGCRKCAYMNNSIILRSNTEEFITKAKIVHGDKYDYSKVIYEKANMMVIFICKKHGEFSQSPNSHSRGAGCPTCVNKTEGKLYNILKIPYSTIIIQYKALWCINNKTNKYLPFDFCIPEHKIIIELDGKQHFQQVLNWTSPEEQFQNDLYKEKCANDNGYSMIRILQEDVYYDTYDWLSELLNAIEELKNGDDVANIYLYKNGEYDKFL